MKKLLTVVLIAVFVLTMTAAAYAAPTFNDVPAKHWAYDAVSKLVKSGLIEGYGDGTFRGDKPMTRYEFAFLTVKAIDKFDQADNQQKALINKLSGEFADELNHMGARVAKLETKTNAWVFGGDFRSRYLVNDPKYPGGTGHLKSSEKFDMRERIGINGQVADNVMMQSRLVSNYGTKYGAFDASSGASVYFDLMNVTATDTLGLDRIRTGRSAFDVLGNAFIGRPNCADGTGFWATMGALKFNAWTGNVKSDQTSPPNPSQLTAAQFVYRPNQDFKMGLGYYWADYGSLNQATGGAASALDTYLGSYAGSRGFDLSFNIHTSGLWIMTDYVGTKLAGATGPLGSSPRGWVVQVTNGEGPGAKNVYFPVNLLVDKNKKGTSAWAVSYRSVDAGTIPGGVGGFDYSAIGRTADLYNVYLHGTDNVKALYLAWQTVLQKNVVMTFEWQDLKVKNKALVPNFSSDQIDRTLQGKFEFFF
jgi:hypothetical protein